MRARLDYVTRSHRPSFDLAQGDRLIICLQAAQRIYRRGALFERFELLLQSEAIEQKFSSLPEGLRGRP
jgi:hypothetical protein